MLKKILSVVGIIGGAALSTFGVVTLIKNDDVKCSKETQTTTTETVTETSADDAE